MRSLARGFLVMGLITLLGCASGPPTAKREDMSYLYGKNASDLQLDVRVYHTSEERSTIYFKLRTQDLLYKSKGGGAPYHAQVLLSYATFPSWNSKELLDSASTLIRDVADTPAEDKELIGTMDLDRHGRKDFVLKVIVRDLNRETGSIVAMDVHNGAPGLPQDFLPMAQNGTPFFSDNIPPASELKVRCERLAGRTLSVGHYVQEFRLPPPVFSTSANTTVDMEPDSVGTVTVSDDGTFTIKLADEGFYHFRADSASRGYTVFLMPDGFPLVHRPADMLPPLRYITSMQEFDKIATSQDLRKAIESFWSGAFGDRERTRAGIRTFYGRVENANRHFSSYVEGWRTDRGMVHIIFGTPNTIHRGERSETWIYGDGASMMSLHFNFVKRDLPFTDNDLVLERDPVLKSAWYRNVESWRNGRVYQN